MGFLASLTGKKPAPSRNAANDSDFNSSKYRGVQVKVDTKNCCEAVRSIAGDRFLSNDVPKLPLESCDVHNCQCTYKLYDDRRTDFRRASDVGFDIASQLSEEDNRSSGASGRRSDD